MTRVLVAGATGYVGRFVATECKRRGHWVRVLARRPEMLGLPGRSGDPAIADLVDDVFVGEVTKPGGPVTYTYREIAELAFAVLGRPPRIRRVPVWLARLVVSALRPFSRRSSAMAAGIVTISQVDSIAPASGTHTLKAFFEELVTDSLVTPAGTPEANTFVRR